MWTGHDVVNDVEGGSWVGTAITGFATSRERYRAVGSVLPPVFDAYARVLHRANRRDGAGEGTPVRWAEVAERNGRTIHPLVEWASLQAPPDGGQSGLWDAGPSRGRPDSITLRSLKSVLPAHTTTESCFYAVWEGNTALDNIRQLGTRLTVGGYDFFVVRDDVSNAGTSLCGITPSLWWPDDRSWCVASDIDLQASYVGGTHACIDEVLSHPDLEAFPVTPTDPVTSDSDTVNPPPMSCNSRSGGS